MAAGSTVALGSCTQEASPALQKQVAFGCYNSGSGRIRSRADYFFDDDYDDDSNNEFYEDYDDYDYCSSDDDRIPSEDPSSLVFNRIESHPTMLRSSLRSSKALSSLSRQAAVAAARDLRDHFPSRHTLESSLHTLSLFPPRPSPNPSSSCSSRIGIPPQNLFQLPPFKSTPSPGPSYTNRATDNDPESPPIPTNATESTVITDSSDPNVSRFFQYGVSVSYVSKSRRWDPSNTFNFSPYKRVSFEDNWVLRKKARPKTGQDAFFVSRVSDTGAVAFGVADGVGGYSMSGIDSADFSHTLCEDMAEISYHSEVPMRADMLIEAGYISACSNPNVLGGGSTACVGVAKPDGTMEAANLGDSGFVILRGGRVHHTSQPQTHAFNTPFQLSVIPLEVIEQARKFGGPIPISDRPRDAHVDTHDLQHGDVLIFATDGLWDNLSAQDVLRLVSNEMVAAGGWVETPDHGIQTGEDLSRLVDEDGEKASIQGVIAKKVASKAKDMSVNTKIDGPFAKEVRRYFPGEVYHGGKRDDICVLCCIVVEWAVPTPKPEKTETPVDDAEKKIEAAPEPPKAPEQQPPTTPPPPQSPPAEEVPPPQKEEAISAFAADHLRGLPGGGGPGAPSPRL
ncbi:uncharacterized protein DFL_007176 [Arthrobotrys flagrans]|uniref:Protein phosphatase n=1 Tax=Arthrobotrys flagrans TaxID=97331 RepID=A0A436ZUX0_ARTFL|nr:hypothetical protein DFL_007176 [Arthrobotrys flagrans]